MSVAIASACAGVTAAAATTDPTSNAAVADSALTGSTGLLTDGDASAFVGWMKNTSFILRFGQPVAITQIVLVASANQTGTKRPPGVIVAACKKSHSAVIGNRSL